MKDADRPQILISIVVALINLLPYRLTSTTVAMEQRQAGKLIHLN